MDLDGFNRNGDPFIRRRLQEILAEKLSVDFDGVRPKLRELHKRAEAGRLSDSQIILLNDCVDMLERVDALDHPWTFAHRYMRSKFISNDPICMNCKNMVPHRTMLVCPNCGAPGPWTIQERKVTSSYIHYLLVEQVYRLMNGTLLLNEGSHYADGITSAVPRGGAKSTWMCEIVSTWLVLTGRSRCLLVLSNTIEQVSDRCNEIKTGLEENNLIIKDFGVQAAKRQEPRTWSKSDFILPNRGRVVGKGAMQSMRGVKNNEYRPDCVIADDADDDKFMTTPERANTLYEWWDSRVVPACHPNAVFLFSGTVIGEMALLWQLLQSSIKVGGRGATTVRQTFSAIRDFPGCKDCGMPTKTVGMFHCPVCAATREAVRPSSYWGARFTVAALAAIKSKIGYWAWQTEYEQSPNNSTTSWFKKDSVEAALRPDLSPPSSRERRLLPMKVIASTITGSEAVRLATMADPYYAIVPGDPGPYQIIVQAWDPAWARAKPQDQQTAWMAGVTMGLTYDDKFVIMKIQRDRALPGTAAYRDWMYKSWTDDALPGRPIEDAGSQIRMIIESNGAGVLFQYGVEEHWGSIPYSPHQTGTEKHDLVEGIPGMASAFIANKFIIVAGGSEKDRENLGELKYELQHSGGSRFTDVLMATWFGWSFINRWIRDVRDKLRYEELIRRQALKQGSAPRAR